MNYENNLDIENLPNDIIEAIYALVDWNQTIIIIIGRIFLVDGDYTWANSHDAIDLHQMRVKDITSWVIEHKQFLVKSMQEQQFVTHTDALPTRILKTHKDTKFLQFTKY
tara:strand:+ start:21 stop:350 length:330 start_codon:yes stop_codon:yes gene_type:complete